MPVLVDTHRTPTTLTTALTEDLPPTPGALVLPVQAVLHPPGRWIGECDTCHRRVPYGSGWRLVERGGFSRLVCGELQAHRTVNPVL